MDRADDPLAEIRWLETLDKSSGVAIRYIGFTDLAAPDAALRLSRLDSDGRRRFEAELTEERRRRMTFSDVLSRRPRTIISPYISGPTRRRPR